MTLFMDQQDLRQMWYRERNKKKEGANHRNLRLNWEGTPPPPSKISDTLSFVGFLWLAGSWDDSLCPVTLAPYSHLSCPRALKSWFVQKNYTTCQRMTVLCFSYPYFLKSTRWLYFSICEAGCVSPGWLWPGGWCHVVGGHPARLSRAFLCLPWETWLREGTLASNSCFEYYWKELSLAKYSRAVLTLFGFSFYQSC